MNKKAVGMKKLGHILVIIAVLSVILYILISKVFPDMFRLVKTSLFGG